MGWNPCDLFQCLRTSPPSQIGCQISVVALLIVSKPEENLDSFSAISPKIVNCWLRFSGGQPILSESPLLSKRLHRPFEGHLVGAGEKDLPVELLALALRTFGLILNTSSLVRPKLTS